MTSFPPISVVVTAYEQCDALRYHLPMFLEQEYPTDYEVIVVDMNSRDDTMSLLEQMESRYPHLHAIKTPASARDISPTRLALTLGIRAASYDWVVLTQADCQPVTPHWLSRMAEGCSESEGTQIVLGYTRFVDGRGWHGLRCRFFRAWQQRLHLTHAKRHRAYRADGTNLCYRRSLFLAHRGFADHANLLAGATDIMVNTHSTKKNTTVCLHSDAVMLQTTPRYRRWWSEERLYFMETRRHFRQGLLYRLRYFCNAVFPWLCTLLLLADVLMGIVSDNYPICAIAIALWLLYFGYRTYSFNKAMSPQGEPPIRLALPLLLHLIPLWDTAAWLRWLFTKRRAFRKKYL